MRTDEITGGSGGGHGQTVVSVLWGIETRDTPMTIVGPRGESETRTHGQLLDEAEVWASGLVARGVGRGRRVGLIAETSFDFIVECLAVWRAGGVVVPLPPAARRASQATWGETVSARLTRGGASHLITAADLEIGPAIDLIDPASLATSLRDELPDPVSPGDEAVLQFSSGSTSEPKGVLFTHGKLVVKLRRYGGAATSEDLDLRCTPLHFAGLGSSIIQPIADGRSGIVMHPDRVLRDPESWLLTISREQVTHAGAPNFVYALSTTAIAKGLSEKIDLSLWRVAPCGYGEAPDYPTISRFAEAARPFGFRPEIFQTAYASTEAAVVSSSGPRGIRVEMLDRGELARGRAVLTDDAKSTPVFSSGPLVKGVSLRVVGPDGTDVGERQVGELLVRTDRMMDGYDEPAANEAAFEDGWFVTGDLGYLADGELFVTGRSKDMIIVNGQNFHSVDLEGIASGALDDGDGRTAAFAVRSGTSEAAVLVVETAVVAGEQAEELRKRLARAVWEASGLAPKQILFVAPDGLPLTPSGKLQRAEVKRLFESGELPSF